MPEKPHLNIVTAGHVDHGKSTLMGRLLYETGAIREEELQKLKQIAKELGRETWEFAFILDKEKEERARGLTIDVMHRPFETRKYFFTIIDAPGHRDFVKNMITGASQADGAILVVSAKQGEGVQEQTKEHVFLLKVLGVNQLVVAINKMDTVNFDQKRYEEVKNQVIALLKPLGYNVEKIHFVPVSAWTGDNIVKKSDKMPWYNGPTLVEALDTFEIPPRPIDKPLRIPIQDVYSITGVGTVPVGKVETGVLKVGDTVVFEPAGVKGEVKSIEMHHQPIQEAKPGDNIGFNVRGVSKDQIRRGDVAGHPDNPPTVASEFTAQIVVLQHPTVIAPGYTPVFHAHTASVACTITEILAKIDPKTGQVLEEKPSFIKTGDAARIKAKPIKPLVIEKQSEFPQLARFAIRDMGITVAAGVCLDVVKAK
ncbi:MAG: translation elongation factor EF-1 subunit alpha [Candidatus Aenigmarchaeota archaeon ex4484_224]|nr:MAG: translation elongation factor EF-1 subunit alpha [Candidatus Aenigmarchaeota archaeon ex4484_224]